MDESLHAALVDALIDLGLVDEPAIVSSSVFPDAEDVEDAYRRITLTHQQLAAVRELRWPQASRYNARLEASNRYCVAPPIEHLQGLELCCNLEVVDLAAAASDLAPLAHLAHLRVVKMSSSEVTDVAPLACCPRLAHVSLSLKRLRDIAPLSRCDNLQVVHLTVDYVRHASGALTMPGGDTPPPILSNADTPSIVRRLEERGVSVRCRLFEEVGWTTPGTARSGRA